MASAQSDGEVAQNMMQSMKLGVQETSDSIIMANGDAIHKPKAVFVAQGAILNWGTKELTVYRSTEKRIHFMTSCFGHGSMTRSQCIRLGILSEEDFNIDCQWYIYEIDFAALADTEHAKIRNPWFWIRIRDDDYYDNRDPYAGDSMF